MRRLPVVLLAMLFALASCARHEQEHDHGTAAGTATVSKSTDGGGSTTTSTTPSGVAPVTKFGEAQGYVAAPQTSGKHPAIIVVPEWWGLDGWIRENTDRFAGQGYVALAVDLYRGKVTSDPAEAHELSRGLPEDRAIADLKAAYDYLASRPDVDPERIGVVGWCLGGGYALALATNEPRLRATVINYGRLVTDPNAVARINSQLLGNFGGADRGIPPEDVRAFGAMLTKQGKDGDIKVYDGAGHAFMNPNNKQGYDEAAAKDAWTRIDLFFGRTLRDKIPNS